MKRALSLSILALLVAASAFASRRIVPLAGHVHGVNSFWTTDLQIANTTTQAETVRVTFYPTNRAAVSRDISLGARESILVRDVTAPEAFGLSGDTEWLGQLQLESAGDYTATVRTFTTDDKNGTFGSVSDSVDPSLLATGGTITGLVADDRFRTNIALVNASDDTISVHFDLRRRDGSIAGSDDIPIGPHVTRQISAAAYVHRADDSPFSVRWNASGAGYLVASTVDNSSGDPTESRSIGAPSTSQFFPLVGKTPGALGTFWTTSLSITNTEDRVASVTIEYQGNEGTHLTRTVSIPPYGTFQNSDIFQFFNLAEGSGFLTITSTAEITSSARVFNTRVDGATFGSALLPQEHSSRSGLSHVRGVRRDDDFRLNVTIADDNGVDADGTIRLYDDRHSEVESQRFHVPSQRSLQFSMNQTHVSVGSGEIEVETEHGVQVSVIASNIDNHSGDTVARETEQENERQQDLEIQMSTRTPAVGTPVTFTAVASASMQVASYRWDFGDGQSGEGKSVTHSFASGGEFNVTLMLTLASGATLRKAEDITVSGGGSGGASGFDFSWSPQSPAPGQPVTFTAVVSGAAKPGAFVKWHIDGQRPTGASITYTFATAGSFEVEAELEQEGAVTLQATHVVSVGGGGGGGGATAFDFTWSPQSPAAGAQVAFTAVISGTPKAGAFVKWNIEGLRPTGNTVTHSFGTAGSYEVEAELEQEGAVTLQATHVVNVGGGNPGGGSGATAVDFTWTPSSPHAGQLVSFSAAITGTPLSGSELKWKFPDDSRPLGSSTSYTFGAAGTYTVSFEVAQPGRATIQREKSVTVAP
jgi:plastocyanin